MKKIFWIVIMLFCLPLVVHAIDYDISNYYIDATLKENGDMDVKELIVLDGTFNGYERYIYFKSGDSIYNASNIENLNIYAKHVNDVSFATFNEDFDLFKETDYASNGDMAKYVSSNFYTGVTLRMYYATSDAKSAFLITYTLKDVGIYHLDSVEYYWNFLGVGFEDDIKDLQIRVNYLTKMNENDFHWWFHGPLEGTSKEVDISSSYTSVLGQVKKLDSGTAVDFRTLAPQTGFAENLFSKKDNESVKESIIEAEDAIVAKDNALRKKAKTLFYIFEGLSIGYYIILIGTWIYVYKKYDKERKPKFTGVYNREFIDDYNVEVIDYLFNLSVTPNAMSASIMNLIYKKNITVQKLAEDKNNYVFTLVNRDNLNVAENYLIDFLFNKVGSDNKFTTKKLKSYAASTKTCNSFMDSYTKWKSKVLEDGKSQGFYDTTKGKYGYGFYMLFLSSIIYFASVRFNVKMFLLNTLIFSAAIFIIYIGTIKRKSEKGIEHYTRWKAFKKFLNDFGTFDTKELPEIILWERYLVYATIFGLAKKVQKDMNVKIQELSLNDAYYTNHYIFISDYDLTSVLSTSFNDAVTRAQSAINRDIASSSSGSFGGHGGGFSSGGGFGGGGGGGRGF